MRISDQALRVAATGGYSEDRYVSWPAVAQALLDRGFSMVEAEAIMRSKWTRWAGDMSDAAYGQCTHEDVLRFIDSDKNLSESVAKLVEQIDSLLEV